MNTIVERLNAAIADRYRIEHELGLAFWEEIQERWVPSFDAFNLHWLDHSPLPPGRGGEIRIGAPATADEIEEVLNRIRRDPVMQEYLSRIHSMDANGRSWVESRVFPAASAALARLEGREP